MKQTSDEEPACSKLHLFIYHFLCTAPNLNTFACNVHAFVPFSMKQCINHCLFIQLSIYVYL